MMKKYLMLTFAAVTMLLCGCTKQGQPAKDTTYTFEYKVDDKDNVAISGALFEYNEAGERIASTNLTNVKKGFKKEVTANKRTVKVKVYITMSSTVTKLELNYWVGQVFYLEEGANTAIVVDGQTRMSTTEP